MDINTVLGPYKTLREMLHPDWLRPIVDTIVALFLVAGLVVGIYQTVMGTVTRVLAQVASFRLLPPPKQPAGASGAQASAAAPVSKDQLAQATAKLDSGPAPSQAALAVKAAGDEPLTRHDALALFDHLAQTMKKDAPAGARDAFADAVQSISAAPKEGEREALVALAEGKTGDAVKFLSSESRPNPEQLQTLAALTAVAAPEVAAAAYGQFVSTAITRPLGPEHKAMSFTSRHFPGVKLGLMTGDISEIKTMDAWVNSENDWLLMARPLERSIAANIRYLSAQHVTPQPGDEAVNGRTSLALMKNDPMQRYLRPRAYHRYRRIPLGSVRVTKSGNLIKTHNVKRILHVVAVTAYPLGGVKPGPHPGDYVRDVMRQAERFNRGFLRSDAHKLKSMVIPLFGTGMAGVNPESVTDEFVDGLLRGVAAIVGGNGGPVLKTVNLLAFSTREYIPLRRSFEKRVITGDLEEVG